MHNLKPITPLGHAEPRVDTIGSVTISEVVDRALVSVATREGNAEALRKCLSEQVGLTLPEVGRMTDAAPYVAFWSGPEQWMISAPHDSHELLASELKAQTGAMASVVEQTDGWCWFAVEGDALEDLFERLSNVPIRTMEAQSATRTTVEHLGVFLLRNSKTNMTVLGPRSSAGSLHHALTAAALSIA